MCNTTGDGWRWDVSERWVRAREEVEGRKRQGEFGNLRGGDGGFGGDAAYDERDAGYPAGHTYYDARRAITPGMRNGNADVYPHSPVSMQTLDSRGVPSGAGSPRRDHGNGPLSGTMQGDAASDTVQSTGKDRVWGGRYKRDVDCSGEDGEEGLLRSVTRMFTRRETVGWLR